MAMTKEKLLITRYMCTGTAGKPLWYLSRFNHGDVIEMDGKGFCEMKDRSGGIHLFKNEYFTDFPHLFRPMPWWENRQPEDMPEYVSWYNYYKESQKEVGRVLKWWKEDNNWRWAGLCGDAGNFAYWKDEDQYQPATEQEYLDYINQKEG